MSEPMTWYRGRMIPRSEYERIIAGEAPAQPEDNDATTNHNGSPADGRGDRMRALWFTTGFLTEVIATVLGMLWLMTMAVTHGA